MKTLSFRKKYLTEDREFFCTKRMLAYISVLADCVPQVNLQPYAVPKLFKRRAKIKTWLLK
ncbi:hypothetical protein HMPREF1987_01771 [Peptostreptococcaceae bacterium oral taxon 113 str. W5053]|nr:hypothetical protein HMPREF1987_01771 [Peptostreptococcaceae bacterium oral taxon 113 str. W5053]